MRLLHTLAGLTLLSALLLTGCGPKKQVTQLATPARVAVAISFDSNATGRPQEVPEVVVASLRKPLTARNLEPNFLELSEFADDFERRRATSHRFAHLSELKEEADLVLLVEAQASFYSQLNGRFRWTVQARCTMGRPEQPELAVERAFEVPVFLRFPHEAEAEALAAASDMLRRRVAELAEVSLGDPGAPWQQPGGASTTQDPPINPRGAADPLGPIYFVMVDRFHNGNTSNDGSTEPENPRAFHGGDLAGLTSQLQYLQDLGVKTLWLSPITRMRRADFGEHGAFHGYWMEHPGELDPHFGDASDLEELRKALKARGMGLILDQVVNHVGYDSKLVEEKPHWFHNHGDIVDWDDPKERVLGDVHGLPDLAQEKQEVGDWLIKHSHSWLTRTQPVGFRLDAVRHVPLDFWRRYNQSLRAAGNSDLVLLGEIFDGDPQRLAESWRSGEFSHVFDFPLYYALNDVFCRSAHPGRLAATLSADEAYPEPARLVTFADNHDVPRVHSACQNDPLRTHQLLAFQFSARGVPALTYGTEAGMTGITEVEARSDMNFSAAGAHPSYSLLQQLIRLRSQHPALRNGTSRFLALDEELFAYLRVVKEEAVAIVLNRGNVARSVQLPQEFADAKRDQLLHLGTEEQTGRHTESAGSKLEIEPNTLLLIALRPSSGELFTLPKNPSAQVPTTFSIAHPPLAQGEQLFLVGAGQTLGNWQPEQGLGPLLSEDDRWTIAADFGAGSVLEYKLVVRDATGASNWEEGPNRYLLVEDS